MSNCTCQNNAAHVPDFTATGFAQTASANAASINPLAAYPDVQALKLSACVSASYNSSTNQICFSIPIYGQFCIPSPIHIPVGGQLKACAETCGSFIPTGLKVTIYFNGNAIWSGTVWGSC